MSPAKTVELCRELAWDSDFWGFPIARVERDTLSADRVHAIDTWCERMGIRCLYFLSRSDDALTTRQAELASYQLVDIRLTLHYEGGCSASNEDALSGNELVVRQSLPQDVPALRAIAGHIHQDTRFYFDLNFSRQGCDRLYETWIQRSCEGYADVVLVADLGGEPVGYISCHIDPEASTGSIGLVGVSSRARGRGAGQMLVQNALQWFASHEVEEIHVVTQGRNSIAQRLYQRAGFRTRDIQLWYHKWYPSSGTADR